MARLRLLLPLGVMLLAWPIETAAAEGDLEGALALFRSVVQANVGEARAEEGGEGSGGGGAAAGTADDDYWADDYYGSATTTTTTTMGPFVDGIELAPDGYPVDLKLLPQRQRKEIKRLRRQEANRRMVVSTSSRGVARSGRGGNTKKRAAAATPEDAAAVGVPHLIIDCEGDTAEVTITLAVNSEEAPTHATLLRARTSGYLNVGRSSASRYGRGQGDGDGGGGSVEAAGHLRAEYDFGKCGLIQLPLPEQAAIAALLVELEPTGEVRADGSEVYTGTATYGQREGRQAPCTRWTYLALTMTNGAEECVLSKPLTPRVDAPVQRSRNGR